MATEEYSVGYDAGYQDGWNAASGPAAQWVGLTDEEVRDLRRRNQQHDVFARAIEAKLREKNTPEQKGNV